MHYFIAVYPVALCMGDTNSSESPLDAVAGDAGPAAIEAFKLLGHETRLAILLALWESYKPFHKETAVGFAELRERVGTPDSGQFNYHLDKLTGHFVEATDEGYTLREAGLKFVRAVIAGAGIDQSTLKPTEINMTCQLCGGTVEVLYEDGWVSNRCTECEGLWTDSPDEPTGQLSKLSLDPAGLTDRSPGEIYAAAWVQGHQRLYSMIEGVCGSCSGRVERSLDVCNEHDSEGMCANCGRYLQIIAQFRCTVCKDWGRMTPGGVAKYHPAVVAFHYDHGITLQYSFNELSHINNRLETGTTEWELVSEEPPRVQVTIEVEGDQIRLELTQNLSVRNIEAASLAES